MTGFFEQNIKARNDELCEMLGIKNIPLKLEQNEFHVEVKHYNPMYGNYDDINRYYPDRPVKSTKEVLAEPAPF